MVVSHSHDDHWSDLVHLGYLRTLPSTYRPLTVIGPSDAPQVLRRHPDAFDFSVAAPGPRTLGPFTVRLARVDHGECWATRVDDRLCYTADTGPCDALDEFASGCRVLLAPLSGSDVDGPLRGHLTAGDAGRPAARSGARLLVLTHLGRSYVRRVTECCGCGTCGQGARFPAPAVTRRRLLAVPVRQGRSRSRASRRFAGSWMPIGRERPAEGQADRALRPIYR